jgi:hypothetical protein
MANLPKRVPQPAPPVLFPEAEQRLVSERPIEPAIRKAIVEENNVRPPYSRIRVPVVAVYRTTTTPQALKEYPPQNDKERAAFEQLRPSPVNGAEVAAQSAGPVCRTRRSSSSRGRIRICACRTRRM